MVEARKINCSNIAEVAHARSQSYLSSFLLTHETSPRAKRSSRFIKTQTLYVRMRSNTSCLRCGLYLFNLHESYPTHQQKHEARPRFPHEDLTFILIFHTIVDAETAIRTVNEPSNFCARLFASRSKELCKTGSRYPAFGWRTYILADGGVFENTVGKKIAVLHPVWWRVVVQNDSDP
jgi:hypothetical protein